jgi:ubiquinol-cytochrome c reductase cytochrome b subunit
MGMATFAFYGILFLGGAADVLSVTFGVSVNAVLWSFRIALFVVPPLAAWATWALCRELSARDGLEIRSEVTFRDIPSRLRQGSVPDP